MTVRTTPDIAFGPHDFKRTDRDVTWGIKVTQVAFGTFVTVFIQQGQQWIVGATLDDAFDTNESEYPDMTKWLRLKCVPALNAWLAQKFPPLDQPPPALTRAEQADALIQGLRIAMNPVNGTLTATAG